MHEKQIFISHSSMDNDFASKLYEELLWEGYPVWMDSALKEAVRNGNLKSNIIYESQTGSSL